MEEKKQYVDKLEEAAEEYRRKSFKNSVIPQIDGPVNEYGGSIIGAFIAGAQWQKEQMMEEAVDAKVWESEHGFRDLELPTEQFQIAMLRFDPEDNVKIIIVKP